MEWFLTDCSTLLYQEVFSEMEEKYGEVEEMNICDNLGDHLVGNVYVKVSVASRSLHKWFLLFFFCCFLLVVYHLCLDVTL